MLQAALEDEVNSFLEFHAGKVDVNSRRQVVRNGYMPSRELATGAGNMEIQQPRVRDKSSASVDRVKFSLSILLPYLSRSKAIDEWIRWLDLKGIFTADFLEALQSLTDAPIDGVSANTIVRLKETWTADYEAWNKRDLSETKYDHIWAKGFHVNVRLEDQENQRQCILVVMGATTDGQTELIAVRDGHRESERAGPNC